MLKVVNPNAPGQILFRRFGLLLGNLIRFALMTGFALVVILAFIVYCS